MIFGHGGQVESAGAERERGRHVEEEVFGSGDWDSRIFYSGIIDFEMKLPIWNHLVADLGNLFGDPQMPALRRCATLWSALEVSLPDIRVGPQNKLQQERLRPRVMHFVHFLVAVPFLSQKWL